MIRLFFTGWKEPSRSRSGGIRSAARHQKLLMAGSISGLFAGKGGSVLRKAGTYEEKEAVFYGENQTSGLAFKHMNSKAL